MFETRLRADSARKAWRAGLVLLAGLISSFQPATSQPVPYRDGVPVPSPAATAAHDLHTLSQGKDYLYPEELGERWTPSAKMGGCFDCSEEVVTYRDFGGNDRPMVRYTGRHVAILVPEVWPHDQGFTRAELAVLLDRSDILYEHFRDLVGREPGGAGPLPIAFVPETCGFGCGVVGGKGIEVLDGEDALRTVREDLEVGVPHGVIVHEMTHNFDVFAHRLRYLSDHAHAWTDFISFYIHAYSRQPNFLQSADEIGRHTITRAWRSYINDLGARWDNCVRDESCPGLSANAVWGSVAGLLGLGHGPDAVKSTFEYLGMQTGSTPEGAEAREDLHVEAWAAGTETNLGCYADAWRWQASPALRSTLSSLYGDQAEMCLDRDGDGFNTLLGDCDDLDPAAFPGATETADGRDNNCNRAVDDLLLTEPGNDFSGEPKVALPSRIEGRIRPGDGDLFRFDLGRPGKVRIEVCSEPDYQGWIFVYKADGSWLDFHFVDQGTCRAKVYELDQARTWRFGVELNINSTPGAYSVLVDRYEEPVPTRVEVEPSCITPDGTYPLVASSFDLAAAPVFPTHVKFWVSGLGFVGEVPFENRAAFDWQPPAPLDGAYTYRAQLFANGNPVSDVSPARELFQSTGDGDGDGIPDACDATVTLPCDDSAALCLNNERFLVNVSWRDFLGNTGTATAVPFGSNDSGLLWFFNPDNWEMLIKVLDGCAFNGHFWVFAAATTNVEYTLEVTDAETGDVVEYFNPLGNAAAAITDSQAFATCP